MQSSWLIQIDYIEIAVYNKIIVYNSRKVIDFRLIQHNRFTGSTVNRFTGGEQQHHEIYSPFHRADPSETSFYK